MHGPPHIFFRTLRHFASQQLSIPRTHFCAGSGAGYYVDATEKPWRDYYQMYSYVTKELPSLLVDGNYVYTEGTKQMNGILPINFKNVSSLFCLLLSLSLYSFLSVAYA